MERIVLGISALILGGCLPITHTAPLASATVVYSVDDREAYGRVLRSIVRADLAVDLKDVDAGIVQTAWHEDPAIIGGNCFGFPRVPIDRQVRWKIIAHTGTCTIEPETERQFRTLQHGPEPWRPAKDMTDIEADVGARLIRTITEDLQAGTPR